MNTTPIRPGPDDRAELARLLPRPVERELPGDRHREIRDLLSHHMARPGQAVPRRRLAYLGAGFAAALAVAAVGVGALDTPATEPARMSGHEILLAAATTAAHTPAGTGDYWYVRVAPTGEPAVYETWTARDGRSWTRLTYPTAESPGAEPGKGDGTLVELRSPSAFRLGGAAVTVEQIQALPTEPDALRTRIDDLIRTAGVRTGAGRLTDAQRERAVFEGLVSVVSQLPAPPNVRAAAFRGFAGYPNVQSGGPVDGGVELRISFFAGEPPATLVIDTATAQVRRSDVVVTADGGIMGAAEGSTFALTAEWTDALP
ncbi:hypothetical protein [Asanoa siamensis]|uniref:CU044_5270 family protein n=1 Tax=Asanoa siamensis TaxID=926357 RepID=A0ABQ4CLW2_9ACTN|nr:hypothetical protein [Asanoa siamensis]GIF72284.1 hypothetical protein Asi02nite_18020 [Asanoa siamensis]